MFEGLKVVELASVLAGPIVGSIFAERGAHVLKVENKRTRGDVTRSWKLPQENSTSNFSAYYVSANYGKKSIFLDFLSAQDIDFLYSEIKTADIVIVNFKPGDALKFALDYPSIKKINPKIIYGEISGFGQQIDRAAYDVVLQAETGYMYMNGEKGSRPLKMPVALIDVLAAHQLMEGILCAYIQKLKTGKGCKVSVSLFDAAISSLVNQASNWLMCSHIPQSIGSEHPNIAPYGDLFQSEDSEWFVLAIGSDKQFLTLLEALGLSDLIFDERFTSNVKRVNNREKLQNILQQFFAQKKIEYLENIFLEHNIPFGIVRNLERVFNHSMAKKLILHENIEGIGEVSRVKSSVFQIAYE